MVLSPASIRHFRLLSTIPAFRCHAQPFRRHGPGGSHLVRMQPGLPTAEAASPRPMSAVESQSSNSTLAHKRPRAKRGKYISKAWYVHQQLVASTGE